MSDPQPLRRTGPAAPVRIVHIGLGNFHRAHQAWYTAHAPDADAWGIEAFTGRRPDMAELLGPQDGLFALITRSGVGDPRVELVPSISRVSPGSDAAAMVAAIADPAVAVITLTITEKGYAVVDEPGDGWPKSAPARIAAGLAARRAAGSGGLTVLPCDNLPGNGDVARAAIMAHAKRLDADLPYWINARVEFASSMVDRITPQTTDADVAAAAEAGWLDAAPVPTEPFSEWVIAGRFEAGRPQWEAAGATFVDDVEPYEQRKLLLLNGAHTLLALAGGVLGYLRVDQAIADERVSRWVDEFWDEAANLVTAPDVAAYRAALRERFANPALDHRLAKIAEDSEHKLGVRITPVLRAERAAGRSAAGAARAVAAWALRERGFEHAGAAVPELLAALDPALAGDPALVATVREQIGELSALGRRG